MGVTLDLRLIDHERIVVRGLEMVNAAIRDNNPEILRQYLATLPIEVDQEVVDYRTRRLAKLRELKAPAVIIENEERLLRYANGEAYRNEAFQKASFDELRELLGTWCWPTNSFSLDKAWADLQWFLEPGVGPYYPPHLEPPHVGDPQQTVYDKALQGTMPSPVDDLGNPIIRTLGSNEPGCFGYNLPGTAQMILGSLERVDPSRWTDHVPFRCTLYRQHFPDMDDAETADRVENDLAIAREVFPVLVAAYARASEKGYGVSCEYSL
jgi:hypothetical protein